MMLIPVSGCAGRPGRLLFGANHGLSLSAVPGTIRAGTSGLTEAGLQPEEAADGGRTGTGAAGV
jgi:hypothetical protein